MQVVGSTHGLTTTAGNDLTVTLPTATVDDLYVCIVNSGATDRHGSLPWARFLSRFNFVTVSGGTSNTQVFFSIKDAETPATVDITSSDVFTFFGAGMVSLRGFYLPWEEEWQMTFAGSGTSGTANPPQLTVDKPGISLLFAYVGNRTITVDAVSGYTVMGAYTSSPSYWFAYRLITPSLVGTIGPSSVTYTPTWPAAPALGWTHLFIPQRTGIASPYRKRLRR